MGILPSILSSRWHPPVLKFGDLLLVLILGVFSIEKVKSKTLMYYLTTHPVKLLMEALERVGAAAPIALIAT